MDGKKYFDLKCPPQAELVTKKFTDFAGVYADETDSALFEQLETLYGTQEVHFLTDDTPTRSLDIAVETIQIYNVGQLALRNARTDARNLRRNLNTKSVGPLHREDSEPLSDAELMKELRVGITEERSHLAETASMILSNAVKDMFMYREKLRAGKLAPAKIAKGAVLRSKSSLIETLEPNTVLVDYTAIVGGDVLAINARSNGKLGTAPRWMQEAESWTAPLQFRVAQGMLELDTFAALTQWCIDRELPALALPAPARLEQGVNVSTGKNANTDMLVVSLTDNKIVPVQVKNSANPANEAGYIPEMVFVTPSRIGLVEPGVQAHRFNGRVRTVPVQTTHYGSHASLLLADLKGIVRKGSHAEEKARLEKAYAYFDYKVLPQLASK